VSQEALIAQKGLKEPRRPAAPARIGATQRAPGRPPPVAKRAILAPTPAPRPTATPVTAPTDAAVSPVPGAATEPPPTPSPVQRGAMVDVDDPGLTRPVPLTQTRPRYPPFALERRLSGTVWLRALVDETGAVVEVSVVRASPRGLGFEDAAMRFMRARVYRPATKQGVPVRVWLTIAVEFRQPDR
jgi:protein TonB